MTDDDDLAMGHMALTEEKIVDKITLLNGEFKTINVLILQVINVFMVLKSGTNF